MKNSNELFAELERAFPPHKTRIGRYTLAQAHDMDVYANPSDDVNAERKDWTKISDEYLNEHSQGVRFLDCDSWVFYLPALLRYAIRFLHVPNMEFVWLLHTLEPGQIHEGAFKLNEEQQIALSEAVDYIASAEEPANADLAQQLLVDVKFMDEIRQNQSGEGTA